MALNIETWIDTHHDEVQLWLGSQRWYGDKSRQLDSIATHRIASVDANGLPVAVLELIIAFADKSGSTYLLLLVDGSDGLLVDAVGDPRFLKWLGDGFSGSRTIPAELPEGGRLEWRLGENAGAAEWTAAPPRVLEGEQSNTSIIFGTSAIVKVFRKIQPGINPDSEIVSYLTRKSEFGNVPPFLGSIRLDLADGQSIELAAVQGFVSNLGDCWRWLPPALAAATPVDLDMLIEPVRLLGQRTGELHVALSVNADDPAFKPIPFSAEDLINLEARLGREARTTASMLLRQGACSYVESEDLAAALLSGITHVDALEGCLQTRVHGDYHLGQVLRVDDDFVIIDFEGEPSRSMDERRLRHSPLKDVAGMLRSIDYAVATASGERKPGDLDAWRARAEEAYLEGYRLALEETDMPLVPREPEKFQRALDLFMIEKALYEVRYELDNRPDWIEIPFGALQRIGSAT